ncbi:glycosyltransferase [Altibacter sp.]|uniref:glycosyltransferase family 2 protein n=1 Tax=Altibacter sp. TaxID=2024823 RepID=UPI00258760F1|nr:glycosyltransferase [Altibacter sp.]MCW9037061.1 glycosyltransferase [Altibacter sp.]
MILVFICIGLIYLISLGLLLIGNLQLGVFSSEAVTPLTRFSIIVPFRNEEKTLPKLVRTFQQLSYPPDLYQLIFVDDASEDASVSMLEVMLQDRSRQRAPSLILSNERHSRSPKKDAITTAISEAKHEWIITTDSDCSVPKGWLDTFDAFIQQNEARLVAGPVRYETNGTMVQNYQYLDALSLQAVAMGSFGLGHPFLCNGANLAYHRTAFESVGGFEGNDHIASGDDLFLLEKIQQAFPKEVHFLKSPEAIVTTQPETTWSAVMAQRIRWASKTAHQKSMESKALGIIVFLTNLLMLAGPVLCLFNSAWWPGYIFLLSIKLVIDYVVLIRTERFFGQQTSAGRFLLNALLYPLVIVTVVFGSITGSYTWKGRLHKKHVN